MNASEDSSGSSASASAEGYEHTIKALRELAELKNECGCHIDDYFDKLSFCEYTDIVFITGFSGKLIAVCHKAAGARGLRPMNTVHRFSAAVFLRAAYHNESALAVNSAKEIFLPSAEGYEHTIKALRELAELKQHTA